MSRLEELGFAITYSGATPNPAWGKHWIHADKVGPNGERLGSVYGYGDDEASAVANAVQTLENHKSEPVKQGH